MLPKLPLARAGALGLPCEHAGASILESLHIGEPRCSGCRPAAGIHPVTAVEKGPESTPAEQSVI